MKALVIGLALAGAWVPAVAEAQDVRLATLAGTRLDIVAEGRVTRVPDVARVNAGVVTQAPSATQALQGNAQRMARVVAALRRAGVAERDIQTSQINLNPDYRYREGQPPLLTGYQASNSVSVRFRDIANAGRILDALVAEGANQINGPSLEIDRPQEALDEARMAAVRTARARAELYARATGKRLGRLLSISEGGGFRPEPIIVTGSRLRSVAAEAAPTQIEPGQQDVAVQIQVSYELE